MKNSVALFSMNGARLRMIHILKRSAMACFMGCMAMSVLGDEVTYEYDALGRLIEVERSDGTRTLYTLDAAGNRIEVKEGAPPSTPVAINVPTASSSGSYTISWEAPTIGNVTAYELYESMTSNFSSQTRIYLGTATSKAVSGKANGNYYYRVRACGIECSAYRTGGNGALVSPSAPASINVPAESTSGSYTVSWGAASGSFSSYQLQEATASNFSNATQIYSGSGSSFNITGRANGTYYYRVRACGSGYCGAYRNGTAIAVRIAPGVPVSVSVPNWSTSGAYTVAWGGSASGTVTAYELWEASNSGFTGATRVHNSATAGWSVTNKANGTYHYRVRACYQTSCSAYVTATNPISVDRNSPSAPGTPTYTVNGTSVTVSWTAASDNVGVQTYEYRLNGAATWGGQSAATSRALTGLVKHTTYLFEVRAKDAAGNAGAASSVSFTTTTDAPPQPTGLNAAPSSQCSWRATWNASSGATYYLFKRAGASEQQITATLADISFNCQTSSFAATRPEYVKACNTIDCSFASNFTIGDTTPPGATGVPQFSNVTSTGATVTWSHASDASGISLYRYRLVGVTSWTGNGTTNTVTLTGLSPSTSYTFEVMARDGVGLDGPARSAPFSTPAAPDTTPPTAPGTPVISEVTHFNARATWTQASDNVGVTGYEYRVTGNAYWTWIGNVQTISIPGLQQLTTYTFEVRAKDGAGNTGAASSRSFTTAQAPPAAPTGLSYRQVYDSWEARWNAVSGATYYRLRDTQGSEQSISSGTVGYVHPQPGNMEGKKPHSVRACNSVGCGTASNF